MRRALTVTFLVMLPHAGWAQYSNPFNGMQWGNPTSAMLDTMLSADIQRMGWQKQLDKGTGVARVQRGRVHAPLASTDFRPPAKGHPTVDAFVASMSADPATQQQYRAAVESAFTAIGRARGNNLATAIAATIGTARSILDGREMPDGEWSALRVSINDALARSPDFSRLHPRDKQAMYDALVIETALLGLSAAASQKDPAFRQTAVNLAHQILTQMTGSAPAAPASQ